MGGTRILGSLGGFLLVAAPLWGQVHPSGQESSSDIPVVTPSNWPYNLPPGWSAYKPGEMEFILAGGFVPRQELAKLPNVSDILLSNRFPVTDTPTSAGSVTDSPFTPMTTLPAGSYPSPYYSNAAGCCGPLGKHGRIGYELYTYTGPNLPAGSGDFIGRLNVGWVVGGGGRALFFNPTHDAAWVIDLGLSYTYNRGEQQEPVFLDIRQPPRSDPITGRVIPQPDLYTLSAIRGLNRTNFNFALGRDWWLWGPATNGLQDGWNLRVGGQVGGRWGTAHVDIVPLNQVNGYARRQNVTHGLYLAAHTSLEVPFGGCILFTGLRAEWGYDWTNIVPPLGGDLKNVNLLLTAGIRY